MSAFPTLADLETFLSTRSYISGYQFSADDVKEFNALNGVPSFGTYPNVHRWAKHIAALSGLPFTVASGKVGAVAAPATVSTATAGSASKPADDFNIFEADDDDATEEEKAATKARQERMALARKLKEEKDAKDGKKKDKQKEAEKSLVVLEVKPWEADTDLEGLWKQIVTEKQQDGLTWGANFKLEPVAYGIKKLVLTATIIDAKVVLDDITEYIESFDQFVQSVEIASMNKI
jgi:elongation factor 1-beta